MSKRFSKFSQRIRHSFLWRLPVVDIFIRFPFYFLTRLSQILIYLLAIIDFFTGGFNYLKGSLVRRLFWGRGTWYRSSFHLLVMTFTLLGLVSGLIGRVLIVQANQDSLQVSYGLGTTNDLLQQGGTIQTVLAVDPSAPDVVLDTYVVEQGESLSEVAKEFKVSADTIRWANSDLVSPFSNELETGWELKIPQMNGVLFEVKEGQTLENIVEMTGGNRIDIIELNRLVPPDYQIEAGQTLFVPDGSLAVADIEIADIPVGVFTNPLSHPDCAGYSWSRGYTGYHTGVDLARYPGCPIRSIATGKVIFAGWSPLAGFNIRIDHGGGIVSKYFHGDGTFWVKVGDRVQQGQEIMMMGTTGNSTGVHLHLELDKDGYSVNPAPYVPY